LERGADLGTAEVLNGKTPQVKQSQAGELLSQAGVRQQMLEDLPAHLSCCQKQSVAKTPERL